MDRRALLTGCLVGALGGFVDRSRTGAQTTASARDQVEQAEKGFADTLARRDHAAFTRFLSEEAIFFGNANTPPLRGKAAVAGAWKKFFEGPTAPFSWGPDLVEVLESGTLALTSGPVRNPNGEITTRFNSIWRREPDGAWRVVFDRGCPVCK